MSIRIEIERSSNAAATKKIDNANSTVSPHLQWRLCIIVLITSDVVTTFAAFWLAYYFRFEWFARPFDPNAFVALVNYRFLLYTVPFLWLAIFAINGLYIKDNL